MRKRRGSLAVEEEENEINLTPMLDVVFIMLIFFIVTSDAQDDASILIAISSNNEIWIDREERDPRIVRSVIERLHAENPKGSIVIQADEGSTHETLVIVMEAAKAAGVTNVAIASDVD